jgi:hypothetical protein
MNVGGVMAAGWFTAPADTFTGNRAVLPFTLTDPWRCEFTLLFTGNNGIQNLLNLSIGASGLTPLTLNLDNSNAPGSIHCELIRTGLPHPDETVSGFTDGVPVQVVLTWTGTHLQLSLDGRLIFNSAGAWTTGLADNHLGVDLEGDFTNPPLLQVSSMFFYA